MIIEFEPAVVKAGSVTPVDAGALVVVGASVVVGALVVVGAWVVVSLHVSPSPSKPFYRAQKFFVAYCSRNKLKDSLM